MREILPAPAFVLLAACASGGGGTFDVPPDTPWETPGETPFDPFEDSAPDPQDDALPDALPDAPADAPGEETTGPSARICVISCSSPETCCTTSSCGAYPDRWSCETGYCAGLGCSGDAECVAWATGLGIAGAGNYKCRGWGEYRSCVPGCTVAEDCCNPYLDCTSYPLRYVCREGGCLTDMCRGDDECRAYAAEYGLFRPDLYVCRASYGLEWSYCTLSCTTEADCCPPERAPCTAYPYRYACAEGLCAARCESDPECQAYASSSGLPNPERYVCREF